MNITNLQKEIGSGKELSQFDHDELKYVQKPLGKAIYKSSLENRRGRPRVEHKAHWSDKVVCDICGAETLRSNQSSHKKRQKHLIYVKINKKLRDALIEDSE